MGRKRNPVKPGEFEDPLSNYDPPPYEDELERALCETHIKDMRITPVYSVGKDTPVNDVIELMWVKEISCVVVVDDTDKPLGVFSSRDVLNKVAGNDAVRSKPISEIMTPNPRAVYATESPAKALNMMAVGGFRHIPVLNADDKVVGILAPRRTTTFLQEHLG